MPLRFIVPGYLRIVQLGRAAGMRLGLKRRVAAALARFYPFGRRLGRHTELDHDMLPFQPLVQQRHDSSSTP